MADVENEVACDYLGITPGSKVKDKFEKSRFHTTKSDLLMHQSSMNYHLQLNAELKVMMRKIGDLSVKLSM